MHSLGYFVQVPQINEVLDCGMQKDQQTDRWVITNRKFCPDCFNNAKEFKSNQYNVLKSIAFFLLIKTENSPICVRLIRKDHALAHAN